MRLSPSTARFFTYFAAAYPGRTALMVAMFVGAGLAEGIGIAGLLPILEIAVGEQQAEPSRFSLVVRDLLADVGLPTTLPILLAIVVVAMVLKATLRWFAMREAGFVTARVGMDLRLRLIRSLMGVEWIFFTSSPTGHFSNAMSSEAHRAAMGYREACAALAGLIQVTVYAAFVILISWQVAVAAVVAGTGIMFVLRHLVASARAAGVEQAQTMRRLVARLTESLPAIKPVKAMGREEFLLPLLEDETRGYNRAQRRQVAAVESMLAFQEPILVAVLALGLYAILALTDTAFSSVIVLAFLFYRLVGGLNQTQHKYQSMATGEGAFESIEKLISTAERFQESARGEIKPPARIREGIELRGVGFSYDERQVLLGVDMEIPSGRFVALLGPSGSGKTTLADLIVGLLVADEGEILVDGVPLSEFDVKAWRKGIGYVPQDLLLFHGSIRRNVTLGNDRIPEEDVVLALRNSGAWSFVSQLPGGLDQPVGERGTMLSGGQRQRIAIARALVERPRLLILDEATTALDPETEAEICRTLAALKGDVTILAISHQMAMRDVADVVYEVANGRVRRTSVSGADGAARRTSGTTHQSSSDS